jgi:hypothetical protein
MNVTRLTGLSAFQSWSIRSPRTWSRSRCQAPEHPEDCGHGIGVGEARRGHHWRDLGDRLAGEHALQLCSHLRVRESIEVVGSAEQELAAHLTLADRQEPSAHARP